MIISSSGGIFICLDLILGVNLAFSSSVCFGNDVISAILFDPVKDHVGVPVFNCVVVWIIIPLSS